ncbi:MAG: hypothetical protein SGJ10_08430 [Bacteroidota bacterium]|nr:hypothetical protein [Bacteroidota bacterium]
MRKVFKYVFIFLCIVGLLAGAAYYWFDPAKALHFVPNLNKLNNIYAKIHSDTAYIEVEGVLENKAPYKLTIDSLVSELELGGVKLVAERQAVNLKQKPGDIDTIKLAFRLPVTKVRHLLKSLRGRDSTRIVADFKITYNTIFGRTTISVKKDFNIKVPNPPEIKVKKVKLGLWSWKRKEVNIELQLEIINHSNKLEVNLSKLNYNVVIGPDITGKGSYMQRLSIKPNSSITVALPFEINVKKPFKVMKQIITDKDSMYYKIHLTGLIDNNSMKQTPISIEAAGHAELVKNEWWKVAKNLRKKTKSNN